MKRLIAAAVLSVILCAAGITGNRVIVHRCETMAGMLDACEAAFESGHAAQECDRLESYYIAQESVLSVFVNHDCVEEIGLSLSRLKGYAQAESLPDFIGECAVLRVRITHIRNEETLGLDSLF